MADTKDVIRVRLDESGYYGGIWFDDGGDYVVEDTDRFRRVVRDNPEVTFIAEFTATEPVLAHAVTTQNLTINGKNPGVTLQGEEAEGVTTTLRERGGRIERYDPSAGTEASAWNLNPPLENTSLQNVSSSRDLLVEGPVTGLDAATETGVKHTGRVRQLLDESIVNEQRALYVETAIESSAGDEDVQMQLHDATDGQLLYGMTITGGSSRTRTVDLINATGISAPDDDTQVGLIPGNEVYVQFNLSTTSATSGATFDVLAARLISQ